MQVSGCRIVDRTRQGAGVHVHDRADSLASVVHSIRARLPAIRVPAAVAPPHTSRACLTAAAMKPANSGCGSNGLLFSSG